MMLTEIKAETTTLTLSEKIELMRFLSDELLKDDRLNYLTPGEGHAVWSQFDAHEAVVALQTLLDKQTP